MRLRSKLTWNVEVSNACSLSLVAGDQMDMCSFNLFLHSRQTWKSTITTMDTTTMDNKKLGYKYTDIGMEHIMWVLTVLRTENRFTLVCFVMKFVLETMDQILYGPMTKVTKKKKTRPKRVALSNFNCV